MAPNTYTNAEVSHTTRTSHNLNGSVLTLNDWASRRRYVRFRIFAAWSSEVVIVRGAWGDVRSSPLEFNATISER